MWDACVGLNRVARKAREVREIREVSKTETGKVEYYMKLRKDEERKRRIGELIQDEKTNKTTKIGTSDFVKLP